MALLRTFSSKPVLSEQNLFEVTTPRNQNQKYCDLNSILIRGRTCLAVMPSQCKGVVRALNHWEHTWYMHDLECLATDRFSCEEKSRYSKINVYSSRVEIDNWSIIIPANMANQHRPTFVFEFTACPFSLLLLVLALRPDTRTCVQSHRNFA